MLRLALKSILAHKTRFALTTGTVVVGVAFVVAAFVVADSLRSTFNELSADINEGTDFTVRGELAFGDITNTVAPSVPESLLEAMRAVDGVDVAEGGFFVNGVIPSDGTGAAVTPVGGGPVAGSNWTDDESISQWYLVEGERPAGISEFAIDVNSFDRFEFALGSDYQVVTPTGPRTFMLAGVMQFGWPENAGPGAVFSIFDTATAQEVLGYPGEFNVIQIRAESGADIEQVRGRIEAALPTGTEIITSKESVEEFSDAFESFIGPFQTILLVFAFIVLFVSMFIISNTFNIVLGQRVRELALLRAVGATPAQVRRSVLAESLAIGAVAAAAGLGLGMLGALGLKGLFSAFGATLPDGPLPLQPRTVAWAIVVGIGFTVAASLVPAVKAARVSPVAGLLGESKTEIRHRRWQRPAAGGAMATLGLTLTARGLFGDFSSTTAQLVSLGVGAALVFTAVAVLSPLIARAALSELARPLGRVFGVAGRLARQNAARSPRRTAATAVALTIGLALVAMVSVVGQSLKHSFGEQLRTAVEADFVITEGSQAGLPKTLADELREAGVGAVVGFGSDLVQVAVDTPADDRIGVEIIETDITVADTASLEAVANLDVTSGSLSGFDPAAGLLVHADAARDAGLRVGDQAKITFVSGDSVAVTVAALYDQNAFWGDWIIDQALHTTVATSAYDNAVAVKASDIYTDSEAARVALDEVLAAYPQASLENRQEFQDSAESSLNTVIVLVNVFLGFALVIALMGIINTLTLSVFERTREIGLLRAVGMTRRQLRRMIRWEAASVALYGAAIGVLLGVAFGVATAVAIPTEIIDSVSVPVLQMVFFLALAVVFGLLAALFPAHRAGRMNVLDAISSE